MNILLSAYHCAPIGSESSVGWHFALELSKLGHQVVVVTSRSRQPFIEAQSEHTEAGIHILYCDLPKPLARWYKAASLSEHLYYFAWQISLFFFAKKVINDYQINLIHHITLGVFRTPSFLGHYSVPFVFGPVGGGENYPFSLKKSLSFPTFCTELLRDSINVLSAFNPLLLLTYHQSSVILCRTKDTLRYIPKRFHPKCFVEMGIGFESRVYNRPKSRFQGTFRLLYAGRPLYWKGVHLLVQAFSVLRARGLDVNLTIVGRGDTTWVKNVARRYQVDHAIDWRGSVSSDDLKKLYLTSDLFVFPSLREAGGTVAIESLSLGLPVLCLDRGGPVEIIDETCGIIVETPDGMSEKALAMAIAERISSFVHNPDRLLALSENAVLKGNGFTWSKVVERTYQAIESHISIVV
ncbi:MAG: glycosyltransferase family 4 protein [Tunicatimonas sp.]